jgi:hypothetical protein
MGEGPGLGSALPSTETVPGDRTPRCTHILTKTHWHPSFSVKLGASKPWLLGTCEVRTVTPWLWKWPHRTRMSPGPAWPQNSSCSLIWDLQSRERLRSHQGPPTGP